MTKSYIDILEIDTSTKHDEFPGLIRSSECQLIEPQKAQMTE